MAASSVSISSLGGSDVAHVVPLPRNSVDLVTLSEVAKVRMSASLIHSSISCSAMSSLLGQGPLCPESPAPINLFEPVTLHNPFLSLGLLPPSYMLGPGSWTSG